MRRGDRVCKECGSGEVEDIDHLVIRCEYTCGRRNGEDGKIDD